MNRLWFGAALLVLFLLMGIVIFALFEKVNQPVTALLEQAARTALSPEPEAAVREAEQALALWEKSWRGIAAVSDHEPMEEIDSLFAQLPVYAGARRWPDFAAVSTRLAQLIAAIAEAQSFTWWSLL